jgi:hypothetical protein
VTKPKQEWAKLPCPGCGDLFIGRLNAICCGTCEADPIKHSFARSRHRIRMEGQRNAREAEQAARMLSSVHSISPIEAERIINDWGRD